MSPQLIEDSKRGKIILSIGAGSSVNLGLPTWGQLIERLAEELSNLWNNYGYGLIEPQSYTCLSKHRLIQEKVIK